MVDPSVRAGVGIQLNSVLDAVLPNCVSSCRRLPTRFRGVGRLEQTYTTCGDPEPWPCGTQLRWHTAPAGLLSAQLEHGGCKGTPIDVAHTDKKKQLILTALLETVLNVLRCSAVPSNPFLPPRPLTHTVLHSIEAHMEKKNQNCTKTRDNAWGHRDFCSSQGSITWSLVALHITRA